ncbi:hypothetical protein TELCIR_01009 [Teladorsagia circumcincta]|uniref:Uncharacterized protein n=1 Tax=Teladorsagia circumcincta TaxID=45464 RepID=A0A2G9V5A4_TELCI|nr:hypothetical protein TELCIR_01009 [Teladorsagia circumcincta]
MRREIILAPTLDSLNFDETFAIGSGFIEESAFPISGNETEISLSSTTEVIPANTTAIDTLTESESSLRVKRQAAAAHAAVPVAAQGAAHAAGRVAADHAAAAEEVAVAVADAAVAADAADVEEEDASVVQSKT